VAAGSSPPVSTADSGELVIESDAGSSPDLIDLTGSSTPVYVTSPTNAGAAGHAHAIAEFAQPLPTPWWAT